MRTLFAFVIIIFSFNQSKCQQLQDIIDLDTVIYLNRIQGDVSRIQFKCAVDHWKQNTYVLTIINTPQEIKTCVLYKIDHHTYKIDSFTLGTFRVRYNAGEADIVHFSCNGEYCVTGIGKTNTIYKFNGSTFEYYDSIQANILYNKSRICGDYIILGKFLNVVTSDDLKKSRLLFIP